MSRFRIIRHLLATAGGGGGGVTYDTRFGNTNSSTGWIDFPLRSGARRVWVDSINGLDSNSGLTSALPKQTFAAAAALFMDSGTRTTGGGDQLMIAGTGGRTYTDTGSQCWYTFGGFSLLYPNAILSYDPANPSDSTKYGKLTGANMPQVKCAGTTPFVAIPGSTGTNYYFVQGIELDAQNAADYLLNIAGAHDGVGFQHCRFKEMRITDNGTNTPAAVASHTHHISKSAFWGQWSVGGNSSGLYTQGIDGQWVQDCIFVHCGWRIGANRDSPLTDGQPNILGHGDYYHAQNLNGRRDRITYWSSAVDGCNIRGTAVGTCVNSIDEPIALNLGGWSTSSTEAPNGDICQMYDFVAMGSAPVSNSPSFPHDGVAVDISNTAAGSILQNAAYFDNPYYGLGNNQFIGGGNGNPGLNPQLCIVDKVHAYGYASRTTAGFNTSYPSQITVSNCITDVALSASWIVDGGGNSVAGPSTFPNIKTRDQVLIALNASGTNYATRSADLVNKLLWRPDLAGQFAMALQTIALPAMGLTQTQAPATSPPDFSGETPRIVYTGVTAAPVLSSPAATRTGTTTATVGATTDTGNGKIWYAVTTSSTTPTGVQIANGQDASGTTAAASGSIAVSSTGAKTASVTGLVNGTTYYVHLMHQDSSEFGNWSNRVTSASF